MAAPSVQNEIADYLADIRSAHSEEAKKLRFQNLLSRLFQHSAAAREVVNKLAQGGEKTIFNIPRAGNNNNSGSNTSSNTKTGYADIAYSNVIIEWEKDLAKTGRHAEDQLAEYLSGRWHSGERYDYVLIATDGRTWRTYVPDLEVLLGQAAPDRSGLRKVEELEVRVDEEERFFYFLDRVLFRTQKLRATLEAIQLDFGDSSRVFINTLQAMQKTMPEGQLSAPVQVAFEQWQRFLQLAYGKFDDRQGVYLIHTYLSVFSKLLAYAVLRPAARPSDDELQSVLSGEAFNALNVANFVEGDFFYWVCLPEVFRALAPALRELYNQIAEYDFSQVQEDILKGIYQELIDIDTRHALGEYYTPDWLCERIVAALELEHDSRTLDPACGSGSFLRALVARFRADWPQLPVQQIAKQVTGIDVHPLSVQIAKTTLLLALGEDLAHAAVPVSLQVYLANTLFLSQDEGARTLYSTGHHFVVQVDQTRLPLDMAPFLGQADCFAQAIGMAQHFAEQTGGAISASHFEQAMRKRIPGVALDAHHLSELYNVYRAMLQAKREGRDSIWQFVLQNLYQPVFMYQVFDAVVANPPWLTYSDITSGDYQQLVRDIARIYKLLPSAKANAPHLDLAAVFLAHCGKYLCKDDAQLAFVLPRAFLSADQHSNTRNGEASGFKLTEVWDLQGVSPLFNVPACVYWATAAQAEGVDAQRKRALPKNGILGSVFSGRLTRPHLHWNDASQILTETPTRWYYQQMGDGGTKKKRSALVQARMRGASGGNAYAAHFKQGATMVPRAFYFVEVQGPALGLHTDVRQRVLGVRTHLLAVEGAKKPWDGISLTGRMQGKYLYRTAFARNVLPFALINPPLVALPLAAESGTPQDGLPGKPQWHLRNAAELALEGDLEAAKWFGQCEALWEKRKSDSARKQKSSMTDWLDWQRKLSSQPLDAQWAVMYTASAKDASACVLDVGQWAQRFLVDYAMYVCFTETEDEARYLEAFLNSGYANHRIKAFQARGLFGPRHVSKKILDLPWPRFDPTAPKHRQLVALGQATAAAVQTLLGSQQDLELAPGTLGRLRSRIRTELAAQFTQMDVLVEAISTRREE